MTVSSDLFLPTVRVADVNPAPAGARWLVHSLWADGAVGIIGGAPKSCKTWFALDLAVSVASASPCLGCFAVERAGPALVYLAEDPTPLARQRVESICQARGVRLDSLDLHLITAPSLRLDRAEDTERLFATCERLRPRLLLLDPFVRLHRVDENHAGEVSSVLAELRRLQRTLDLPVILVHHARKNGRGSAGQALRGSSNLYAWVDSYVYLRRRDDAVDVVLEHRSERAIDPFSFRLVEGHDQQAHLEIVDRPTLNPADLLADQILDQLTRADQPLTRIDLRTRLKVQNRRLGDTLLRLLDQGRVQRSDRGWQAVPRSQPRVTHTGTAQQQPALPLA